MPEKAVARSLVRSDTACLNPKWLCPPPAGSEKATCGQEASCLSNEVNESQGFAKWSQQPQGEGCRVPKN